MTVSSFKRTMLRIVALTYYVSATAQGQISTVQNTTTVYNYDSAGNLTQRIDPLGHITNATYDSLNRLTQLQQPSPTATSSSTPTNYRFDGLNQITGTLDPRQLGTVYGVDGLGNENHLISRDTGTTVNTFDAAGNLLTSTDARGKVKTYTYDALNRVVKIGFQSDAPFVFEYDGIDSGTLNAVGQLTKITSSNGSTAYGYDAFGRLTSKVQTTWSGINSVSLTNSYEYGESANTLGKPIGLSYPSGNRIDYTYDSTGTIIGLSLTSQGGTTTVLMDNINYAPFGTPESWNWGSGSSSGQYIRTFDLDGRLTSYPLGNTSNAGLMRFLNYDAAGRITDYTHKSLATGVSASSYDQNFSYDNLDRLIGVSTTTLSKGYAYDLSGNRTAVRDGSATYSYNIDTSSNHLITAGDPLSPKTFTYDADGNAQSGSNVTIYNDLGRPVLVNTSDGAVAYSYNGVGQRVSKSGPIAVIQTGVVFYDYDELGNLLGEYDANGKPLQETVYLGTTPVAVLIPQGPTDVSVFYVYADQIDTPRFISSAVTNVPVWRWDAAEPFGMSAPDENPASAGIFTFNPRMPGQIFDKETKQFFNNFRTYDPQIGRYVQSDPIGLSGGINTYAYSDNNPLSKSDFFGLAPIPSPNNVPGGPWTPVGPEEKGRFLGPKPESGGRAQCQWVPSQEAGGPPGSKGYFKTNQAGQKGWDRFTPTGEPQTAEQAHPSQQPSASEPGAAKGQAKASDASSNIPPAWAVRLGAVGILLWTATRSTPAY